MGDADNNKACGTCRWWAGSKYDKYQARDCRARPPKYVNLPEYMYGKPVWPKTEITDWCGKYQRRAGK